jgi:hypothetical protein
MAICNVSYWNEMGLMVEPVASIPYDDSYGVGMNLYSFLIEGTVDLSVFHCKTPISYRLYYMLACLFNGDV